MSKAEEVFEKYAVAIQADCDTDVLILLRDGFNQALSSGDIILKQDHERKVIEAKINLIDVLEMVGFSEQTNSEVAIWCENTKRLLNNLLQELK